MRERDNLIYHYIWSQSARYLGIDLPIKLFSNNVTKDRFLNYYCNNNIPD